MSRSFDFIERLFDIIAILKKFNFFYRVDYSGKSQAAIQANQQEVTTVSKEVFRMLND